MDLEGLNVVLGRIHRGEIALVARDTPEPSVFAHEILGAKPYAFLDDAPLEERRSHAVQTRRANEAAGDDLGALDPAAIDRVREEARPEPRDADELHDALMTIGYLLENELSGAERAFLEALAASRRACRCRLGGDGRPARSPLPRNGFPSSRPSIPTRSRSTHRRTAIAPAGLGTARPPSSSCCAAASASSARPPPRSWRTSLAIDVASATTPCSRSNPKASILRGRFDARRSSPPASAPVEWCDRALLARIHRYTVHRLRAEIEPVTPADFMRFLFKWQHVDPRRSADRRSTGCARR